MEWQTTISFPKYSLNWVLVVTMLVFQIGIYIKPEFYAAANVASKADYIDCVPFMPSPRKVALYYTYSIAHILQLYLMRKPMLLQKVWAVL